MNALEGANLNQETLEAMKTGAAALEQIHGKMCVLDAILCEFQHNSNLDYML